MYFSWISNYKFRLNVSVNSACSSTRFIYIYKKHKQHRIKKNQEYRRLHNTGWIFVLCPLFWCMTRPSCILLLGADYMEKLSPGWNLSPGNRAETLVRLHDESQSGLKHQPGWNLSPGGHCIIVIKTTEKIGKEKYDFLIFDLLRYSCQVSRPEFVKFVFLVS